MKKIPAQRKINQVSAVTENLPMEEAFVPQDLDGFRPGPRQCITSGAVFNDDGKSPFLMGKSTINKWQFSMSQTVSLPMNSQWILQWPWLRIRLIGSTDSIYFWPSFQAYVRGYHQKIWPNIWYTNVPPIYRILSHGHWYYEHTYFLRVYHYLFNDHTHQYLIPIWVYHYEYDLFFDHRILYPSIPLYWGFFIIFLNGNPDKKPTIVWSS